MMPPNWSPSDTATVVLFVSLLGAAVTALIIGGRYIAGRMRRWDYPDEFVPDAADMALIHLDNDAAAELDVIAEELSEALVMLRANVDPCRNGWAASCEHDDATWYLERSTRYLARRSLNVHLRDEHGVAA